MGYIAWSVIASEQPTTSKWNILGANDSSFNDGSGLAFTVNNTVPANALSTSAMYLGSAQITSNFTTTSTSQVQVTGLTATVTIPSGGRKTKITVKANIGQSTTGQSALTLWDGPVGSGTQLDISYNGAGASTEPAIIIAVVSPSAGSKTYNVGFAASAGTGTVYAAATGPATLLVEAV